MITTVKKFGHMIMMGILWLPMQGLAYEVQPVENGATLTGTIQYTGKTPTPRIFPVQKNPEICGDQRSLVKVDVTNGLLQGALVVIEGIQQGKPFREQAFQANAPGQGTFQYSGSTTSSLEVQLKHCNFGPFTGVLPTHAPVHFSNQDDVKHVLHTYVARGKKANILRTVHNRDLQAHTTTSEEFTGKSLKDGQVVAFTCDRHEFMENWLYVVNHPYYAMTDQAGNFTVDQIPPGHYRVKIWHPILGTIHQEIDVTSAQTNTLDLDFNK